MMLKVDTNRALYWFNPVRSVGGNAHFQ